MSALTVEKLKAEKYLSALINERDQVEVKKDESTKFLLSEDFKALTEVQRKLEINKDFYLTQYLDQLNQLIKESIKCQI